jgi:hypothetical protein
MAYGFTSQERVEQDMARSCKGKMRAKPDATMLHTEKLCAGMASQNEILMCIIMIQVSTGIQA